MASSPPETHINGSSSSSSSPKPTILHLGEPILFNHAIYARLDSQFHIIQPPLSDLHRPEFIEHLKAKTWGDFCAIMRPFWNTGAEMGRWDRELIELLPRSMRVMASAGAGFDWVETGVLAEYGILYCNGAGASTESVADMALYHILCVFRQMTWSSLAARSNSPALWQRAHYDVALASHNPRGHTLGIIGLGNVGFAIAKKMRVTFGMQVLYHDKERKSEAQEEEVEAIFYEKLDDLLRVSECILLATPATGHTLLNKRTISLLPRGARIVNIARGSLVDEEALADALESGHVAAAGLDVHQREPSVSERLSEMWNVTMTSHTGGSSVETVDGFERLVLQNVEAVLTGREALTAVNRHLMNGGANGVRLNGVNGGQQVNGNTPHHEAQTNGTPSEA